MSQQTPQAAKAPAPAAPPGARGVLQRKCACGGTPGPTGECAECRRKRLGLQRKGLGPAPAQVPEIVHEVLGSPGQPLEPSVRAALEPRFGHDFSRVRVHTGSRAAESARAVSARAYTVGSHVVFAQGQYAPHRAAGRGLLAHELAHVVQQGRSPASGPLTLADERGEAEADRAAQAVLGGQAVGGLSSAAPALSRFAETRTLPQPDRSEVDVTRAITPGDCALVPETRSSTGGGADLRRAFLEVNLCRGRVAGGAQGQINYGRVFDGARDAAADLLRNLSSGQNAEQALRGFGDAVRQLSPEAEVRLSLQAPGFRLDLGGLGRANLAGQASARGTARAEFDLGPLTLGVEGQVEGGTGQQTSGSVFVTVGPRDRSRRPPDCFVCACSAPRVDFSCVRRPPPAQPTPPTRPQPVTVPLFFEYAQAVPRADWQTQYQQMLGTAVARIREGYSVSRIVGNTSPEGPLTRQRPGGFEGNLELADSRARRARDDLRAAIRAALGSPFLLRGDALQAALDAQIPTQGQGELFGSSGGREVANRDLLGHLERTLAVPQAGQPDPLAEQHVTGEGLPPEVRAEVEAQVEQFRTGRSGTGRLTRSQRLEAIYRPLRRALIFLEPPPPPPPSLRLTPRQVEQIVGTPISCAPEHLRLFDSVPLPRGELFRGECREPGERPDQRRGP